MTGLRRDQSHVSDRPFADRRPPGHGLNRRLCRLLGLQVLALGFVAGCSIQIPSAQSLFPIGTPFVLKGTSTLSQSLSGPCPVWIGDNGIAYYLFQDTRLDNELFDRVTTPGVTSRLKLVVRTDLEATCHNGPFVEVLDVLEIVE